MNNNEIGSDLTSISTQGVTITLLGTATDGDEITISPSNNFSRDMEFALRRADIAASASFLISADTKNLSMPVYQPTPQDQFKIPILQK